MIFSSPQLSLSAVHVKLGLWEEMMFTPPPLVPTIDPTPSGITAFHPQAHPLFERALWQGTFRGAVARLMNRSRQLCVLVDDVDHLPKSSANHENVQEIPLAQIKGTVNRCCDFDCEFYPLEDYLEDRWVRVASMLLQGHSLPPVELYLSGDVYYVLDGHHRVSVARALRYLTVEAVIVGIYDDTPFNL
jgi:hypothetical protein